MIRKSQITTTYEIKAYEASPSSRVGIVRMTGSNPSVGTRPKLRGICIPIEINPETRQYWTDTAHTFFYGRWSDLRKNYARKIPVENLSRYTDKAYVELREETTRNRHDELGRLLIPTAHLQLETSRSSLLELMLSTAHSVLPRALSQLSKVTKETNPTALDTGFKHTFLGYPSDFMDEILARGAYFEGFASGSKTVKIEVDELPTRIIYVPMGGMPASSRDWMRKNPVVTRTGFDRQAKVE